MSKSDLHLDIRIDQGYTETGDFQIQIDEVDGFCLFIARNALLDKSHTLLAQIAHGLFRVRGVNADVTVFTTTVLVENLKSTAGKMRLGLFVAGKMDYFQDKFPWSATKELKYPIIENIEWTDGFGTGMLWLCYECTGDEKFRALAKRNVDSFLHRVENKIELDHHDLGFLYSLSYVSGYQLTGSEKAKRATILAADQLQVRHP